MNRNYVFFVYNLISFTGIKCFLLAELQSIQILSLEMLLQTVFIRLRPMQSVGSRKALLRDLISLIFNNDSLFCSFTVPSC